MVGQFVDPDLNTSYWYYQPGKSMSGSYVAVEVDGIPYELIDPDPAVAVLTGPRTASSGEAQVVAFRGRPDTKSFGEPTHGVPTANQGFPLSDGALLNLTVAWMADRTGQTYDSPLPPDVPIPGDPTWDPATDPVVQAAETWVLQAGACGGG
jgi:carboxyl-terminal processing protease